MSESFCNFRFWIFHLPAVTLFLSWDVSKLTFPRIFNLLSTTQRAFSIEFQGSKYKVGLEHLKAFTRSKASLFPSSHIENSKIQWRWRFRSSNQVSHTCWKGFDIRCSILLDLLGIICFWSLTATQALPPHHLLTSISISEEFRMEISCQKDEQYRKTTEEGSSFFVVLRWVWVHPNHSLAWKFVWFYYILWVRLLELEQKRIKLATRLDWRMTQKWCGELPKIPPNTEFLQLFALSFAHCWHSWKK